MSLKRLSLLDEPWHTPGNFMLVGGADRLDPRSALARLFLDLVARAEEHTSQRDIVIVSAATRHPEILTDDYARIFTLLGVDRGAVHAPLMRTRDEANQAATVELLECAAGVYMTGGDQYLLAQVLDDSRAEEAIMSARAKGAIVAGTSAGASALGRPMLVAGGGTGELRLGMVQMSHGLGWAGDDLIIDTHFGARGRFPRLAAAVAEHAGALGIGIDENSCLIINGDDECVVAGDGVVYFLDATQSKINTASHSRHGTPISVGPLHVSILSAGGRFDLRAREIVLESARSVGYNP